MTYICKKRAPAHFIDTDTDPYKTPPHFAKQLEVSTGDQTVKCHWSANYFFECVGGEGGTGGARAGGVAQLVQPMDGIQCSTIIYIDYCE